MPRLPTVGLEMLRGRMFLLLIIACPALTSYGAEDWGSLFTTPSERVRLDALRGESSVSSSTAPVMPVAETVSDASPSTPITIRGYVERGDGKRNTVWVNNVPVMENASVGVVEVGELRSGSSPVQLKLPHIRQPLQLKAGQTYLPATGEITDQSVHAAPLGAEVQPERRTRSVPGMAKQ